MWGWCIVVYDFLLQQEQEVLEGQLAEIRSRLASVQGERAVAEHSLGSQLAQLKEQLLSEQRDKQKQELNLSRQLKAAKAEIGECGVALCKLDVSVCVWIAYSCSGANEGRTEPGATDERRGW